MMFNPFTGQLNYAEMDQRLLRFWQEANIFEKLRAKNAAGPRWSFIDGPITANNPMGVRHGWRRTYKDIYCRYKAMGGYNQRWQNGFDCQGLWLEVEVEKQLGFNSQQDIDAGADHTLDARLWLLPGRPVGDHVEDEVAAGVHVGMETLQHPQQVIAREQIVQRIEVTGDEVERLREP
jgi:tRNA synthetases class I (I, L, M and V)